MGKNMVEDNNKSVGQEFEVLGFRVKLKSEFQGAVDAQKVALLVEDEALKIKAMAPHLENGEIAILVALKLAADKLSIDGEYRDNIEKLHLQVNDALRLIDEVSPGRQ